MPEFEAQGSDKARVWVFNLSWLVLPLLFYVAFEWAFEKFGPGIADENTNLLAFEAALFVVVVGFTVIARHFHMAGWRWPKGLSWLWVAGPMWLAVFTPLSAAVENIKAHPDQLPLWLATSALVAVNEETLFRGFILRGMLGQFRTLAAVIVSSVVFGLLHLFNLKAGGDPALIAAQIVSAAGIGSVFAAMTIRCGSVFPAMILHFLGDTIGLAALGGYEQAISDPTMAPSIAVSGLVFFAWGLFWAWRAEKKGKVIV